MSVRLMFAYKIIGRRILTKYPHIKTILLGLAILLMSEIPVIAQSCDAENLNDKISLSLDVKISKEPVDPIEFVFTVQNQSPQAISVCFSSAKKYDLVISQANREIWRLSSGKMYAQVLIEESINPGEALRFTYAWDRILANGDKLSSGEYTVKALLGIIPKISSNPVIFRIP